MKSSEYLVVGKITDFTGKTVVGYRIVDNVGKVNKIKLDKLAAVFDVYGKDKIQFENAVYDYTTGLLVFSEGSNGDYSSSTMNENPIGCKGSLTVQYTVLDPEEFKPVGVIAYDEFGKLFTVTYGYLDRIQTKYNFSNFDLKYNKKYGKVAVKKTGGYFKTISMSLNGKDYYDSGKNDFDFEAPGDVKNLPCICVKDLVDFPNLDENQKRNVEDRFFTACAKVQKLSPVFYAAIANLTKRQGKIGTMGVTPTTLTYDLEFVNKCQDDELVFVLMHECMHIIMKHHLRRGNRHFFWWNVACDMYINSFLCQEFGLEYGGSNAEGSNVYNADAIKKATKESTDGRVVQTKVGMKPLQDGVYPHVFNKVLDLSKETPETIYDELSECNDFNSSKSKSGDNFKDAVNKGQPQQKGSQNGSQGGQQNSQQGSQGGQQGSQGKNSQQGNQGNNQQGGQSGSSDPFEKIDKVKLAESLYGLRLAVEKELDGSIEEQANLAKLKDGVKLINKGVRETDMSSIMNGVSIINACIEKLGKEVSSW